MKQTSYELFWNIQNNKIAKIKELLQDKNQTYSLYDSNFKRTILHFAATYIRDKETLELIVEKAINSYLLEWRDCAEMTALAMAINFDNLILIKLLAPTQLLEAIKNNNIEKFIEALPYVEWIIEEKFEYFLFSRECKSILSFAAKHIKDKSLLELLVIQYKKAGVLDQYDGWLGKTAVGIAAKKRNFELCELLIKHGAYFKVSIDYSDPRINDRLSSLEIFQLFSEAWARTINIEENPKALASIAGHCGDKAAEIFLDRGVDVKETDEYGETVLHSIHRFKSLELQERIIKKCAENKCLDYQERLFKNTALMIVAELKEFEIINLLIKYGADVTVMDKSGETFLHKLCSEISREKSLEENRFFKNEYVKIGAKAGIINHKNSYEITALGIALGGDDDLIESLFNYGAKIHLKDLSVVRLIKDYKKREFLVQKCAEQGVISKKYEGGFFANDYGSMLQKAAKENDKELVELLLKNGAKTNEFSYFEDNIYVLKCFGINGKDISKINR